MSIKGIKSATGKKPKVKKDYRKAKPNPKSSPEAIAKKRAERKKKAKAQNEEFKRTGKTSTAKRFKRVK